jgi:FKBP-type peptidyl-prolyl cis-trans isomerase (trigger factor)
MKWNQLHDENGYCRLAVEAEWSELAADYVDVVTEFSRDPLPGFRPGKVPRNVIEKRFHREIIDDLAQRAAQRLGREAVREAGIEALGPVDAVEIECERNKPVHFQVRFYPMPKFALPDLGSLKTNAGDGDPRDQISLRLLELVPFDVPDTLVQEELALDASDGAEAGSAERRAASDRIRLMLILRKIARQEGIVVDEKDVNDRIAEKAVEFGTTKELLQSNLEKGGGMQRLKDMLLAESTLEYLMERTGDARG